MSKHSNTHAINYNSFHISFALLSAFAGVLPRHIKLSVARAAVGAACVCAIRAYSEFAGSFSLGSICADACLLLFYVVLLLLERWPECDFELRAAAHTMCIVQLCAIPVSLAAHVLALVGSDGTTLFPTFFLLLSVCFYSFIVLYSILKLPAQDRYVVSASPPPLSLSPWIRWSFLWRSTSASLTTHARFSPVVLAMTVLQASMLACCR